MLPILHGLCVHFFVIHMYAGEIICFFFFVYRLNAKPLCWYVHLRNVCFQTIDKKYFFKSKGLQFLMRNKFCTCNTFIINFFKKEFQSCGIYYLCEIISLQIIWINSRLNTFIICASYIIYGLVNSKNCFRDFFLRCLRNLKNTVF